MPAGFEHVAHPVFFALPNKTPCAICLEAEKEHTARLGRCKHQFCFECIAQVRRRSSHTHHMPHICTRAHAPFLPLLRMMLYEISEGRLSPATTMSKNHCST